MQYILVTVGTSNENLCILKLILHQFFPSLILNIASSLSVVYLLLLDLYAIIALERPNLQGLYLDFLLGVSVEGNVYAYNPAHET